MVTRKRPAIVHNHDEGDPCDAGCVTTREIRRQKKLRKQHNRLLKKINRR